MSNILKIQLKRYVTLQINHPIVYNGWIRNFPQVSSVTGFEPTTLESLADSSARSSLMKGKDQYGWPLYPSLNQLL